MSNRLYFYFRPTGYKEIEIVPGFERVREGEYRYDTKDGERFEIVGPGWDASPNIETYFVGMRATDGAENIIKGFIDVLKKLYSLLKVGGSGADIYSSENEEKYFPPGTERESQSRFWTVTLLTPEEVSHWGREKVRSVPCEIIQEWGDGAMLLWIRKDSSVSDFEERQAVRRHMGEQGPLADVKPRSAC